MAGRAGGKRGQARTGAGRSPADLLREVVALEKKGDSPEASARRAELEAEAAAIGSCLISIEIVDEPIPDPDIEALPPEDRAELERIAERLFDDGASMVKALERLRRRHEHIPLLWNFLMVALVAAGKSDRAERLASETAERFPDYLFGVCNEAYRRLRAGDVEGAGELLETGPRGPRMTLTGMCPGRTRFHITEAVTLARTAGMYLLETGRIEAAMTQIEMLLAIAPDDPTLCELEAELECAALIEVVAAGARRMGRGAKKSGAGKRGAHRPSPEGGGA